MAAIDSRPRRPLSNAHTPQNPPIQTPPKPPGTVPPAVRAITTHPLQFHNGRTGWPQAMQIFAANREDWRQRLENGKSVEKIYHPIYSRKDCSPQMSVQLFIDGPDGLCLKIASFTTSFLPLNQSSLRSLFSVQYICRSCLLPIAYSGIAYAIYTTVEGVTQDHSTQYHSLCMCARRHVAALLYNSIQTFKDQLSLLKNNGRVSC